MELYCAVGFLATLSSLVTSDQGKINIVPQNETNHNIAAKNDRNISLKMNPKLSYVGPPFKSTLINSTTRGVLKYNLSFVGFTKAWLLAVLCAAV